MDVAVVVVLAFGIYAFAYLAGWRTRRLSRHTDRTAESMYDNYADSRGEQQRFADRHGDTWRDDGGRGTSPPV